MAQDATKTAEDRRQAARIGWQTRRQHMAERKRLNLRDAGILLGILLDKAELLAERSGWAGGGEGSAEQSIAYITSVLDAIEPRAVGND